MSALAAPPTPRRASARLPLFAATASFVCFLPLGGCTSTSYWSSDPQSGSGGTVAGQGGASGASSGGQGGTTGASSGGQGGATGGSPEGDSGGSDGGAGDAGDAGDAGGAGGAGGDGAAGDSAGGQGGEGDIERCRVECCDGSLLAKNYPDAAACFSIGVEDCGAEGPLRAEFESEAWQPSVAACPTNRECNLTCCNGEERAHTTFDEPLCVSSARADPFCDERGGPQRVEFDGGVAWEDHECALGDSNCLARCCDGSRSYVVQEAENECAFYGMYACQDDGGPIDIAFEDRIVFTADVECPTARTCILECCDGVKYDRSPGFGTANCVFFNANSSVCADEGHIANKQLLFGGEVAWDGTCP
jgi:hypothetical protein